MNRSSLIRLLFLHIIVVLFLGACSTNRESDFLKIKLHRWYSGTMEGQRYFMQFTSVCKKSVEGIVFADENKTMVETGRVKLTSVSFEILFNTQPLLYDGKWDIEPDKLKFSAKDKNIGQVLFLIQPEYAIPSLKRRYENLIFDSVIRHEVKYASAPGFYQSKPVADMNSESYPLIISEVLNGIGNNLFADELSLTMDIYQPKGDTVQSRPLLVLIHGGAFIVGDKREKLQEKLAVHFAKSGYVVASINYRLGYLFIPGAYSNLERCIHKAVQDSRAALRWLVHNREKYQIDKDNIFMAGNSAGGFIALKTAFMAESETYKSAEGNMLLLQNNLGCLDCSGNSYKEKFRLKGVINMWGALTDLDMLDEFEKVPLLLIHGDSDRIVPYGFDFPFKNIDVEYTAFFMQKVYGSKSIYEKAVEMGFPAQLITILGGEHEPQVDANNKYTPQMLLLQNAMNSFMQSLIAPDKVEIISYTGNIFGIKEFSKGAIIYWQITGGCIIDEPERGNVKIVQFTNADQCILNAEILTKNGSVLHAQQRLR